MNAKRRTLWTASFLGVLLLGGGAYGVAKRRTAECKMCPTHPAAAPEASGKAAECPYLQSQKSAAKGKTPDTSSMREWVLKK